MQVKLAVVGAGGRGRTYADWALEHPESAAVVAVAEPRRHIREAFADSHGIDPRRRYTDWRELLSAGRVADAVIISTQDRMHTEPAVAFADDGWHIMLE